MVGRFQNQRRGDVVSRPQGTFLDAGPHPRVLAPLGGGALGQEYRLRVVGEFRASDPRCGEACDRSPTSPTPRRRRGGTATRGVDVPLRAHADLQPGPSPSNFSSAPPGNGKAVTQLRRHTPRYCRALGVRLPQSTVQAHPRHSATGTFPLRTPDFETSGLLPGSDLAQ